MGELAREPDRWKGAGQPHDRERDTAHFIDMDDQGRVYDQRGMSLNDLPRLKSEYDAALTKAGVKHDYVVTEGDHSWPVWRRYLVDFLPLLFR